MESQTLFTIENLYVSYQNASFCSPSHALPHPLSSLLLIAVPDPGCSLVGQVLAATRATTARLAFDTSRETRWSRPDWQCMIVSVWPQDKVRLWFSRKHPEVKLHRLILGNIGDFGSVVLLRSHSAVTLQCPTLISHRIDHAFTVGSPPPPRDVTLVPRCGILPVLRFDRLREMFVIELLYDNDWPSMCSSAELSSNARSPSRKHSMLWQISCSPAGIEFLDGYACPMATGTP